MPIKSINGESLSVQAGNIENLGKLLSCADASVTLENYEQYFGTTPNFNNAPHNTILLLTKDFVKDIANNPTSELGTLVTLCGRVSSLNAGVVQLYYTSTGKVYRRACWGSSKWTGWFASTIDEWRLFRCNDLSVNSSNYTDYFNDPMDLNDAPRNTSLVITGNSTFLNAILNMPVADEGTLISVRPRELTGDVQMYFTKSNRLFFRRNWGATSVLTWRDWKEVLVDSHVVSEDYYDVTMFNRIAAVGDSYCAGEIHNQSGSLLGRYGEASWASQAARMAGSACDLYAVGGRGAYDFIHSESNNLDTLVSAMQDNPYGLVLIEFGINDSNPSKTMGDKTGGLSYIGSSADVDDGSPENNANSFWGNMCRIIATVKNVSPNTRIALVGMMRKDSGERYTPYNDAIQAIAEYEDVLFINMYDDDYMFGDSYNANIYGNHPNWLGYNGIARALHRQFAIAAKDSSYISQYYGV